MNDNKPEFSLSSYVSSLLLKDAEEGTVVLKLSATDPDSGNNSMITYRSVQNFINMKIPDIAFYYSI